MELTLIVCNVRSQNIVLWFTLQYFYYGTNVSSYLYAFLSL